MAMEEWVNVLLKFPRKKRGSHFRNDCLLVADMRMPLVMGPFWVKPSALHAGFGVGSVSTNILYTFYPLKAYVMSIAIL